MDTKADSKRKKDKHSDNEDRRKEKKSRKHRSRSRSNEDREREKESRRKRKHSRSKSPNVPSKQDRRQEDAENDGPIKKEAPARKAKETDMLNTRTGGAYIPPARLRMMQAQITDKSSAAYQRLAWEALKKSIHGHINKINVGNIGIIIKELLKENIVRGRGLLCRSVIQAQAASPTFTNVYAALVAAVNSRFPNIGELLLKRLVIQFKRGFKRNDKSICISSASFIAHLVNQRVAHEILALELLTLLVESPTDDSVEVAIAFLKECGQKLTEVSSKGVNAIFEMLRNILHEGQLDKRVQYMIEVMFQVWKDGFKDHPALIEELELVPEEEQFTHLLMLDDATDPQDILNVFKFDEKYEDNEQKYKTLSKEILGSDAESGEEDGSEESGSEESDDEEEKEGEQKGMTIIDNTETNLVALRRTIYLTINSSLDFEECAHKLMKMQLKPGQEVELCHMFLDCCAEQRTYEKFYGLLAQRFCNINRMYIGPFEEIFKDSYATAHRLDTNRLRNVSKFFAHLLFTDSISWEVMECVKLNEEDTTSSSRIYIKILFQELAEYMGLKKLNDRLKDPTLQMAFAGIFPRDNPKNTRFSINFFTSIGLGGLTDELREHLKQMPKNVPAPVTDINVESESSSESSSSSDSSSDSSDSSSSDDEGESKKNKKNKKSKDKDKSGQNNDQENEEASNKERSDIEKERWGHDGFYNTYGDDARRHDNRPERSEQNRDNFARPRDVSRRGDNREKENERRNKDDRHNREENLRDNRKDSDSRLEREREQRKDSSGNRRNERNARDDRYDNENNARDRNKRDERTYDDDARRSRDEDRLDRDQRRDSSANYNNRSNRDYDDKNRDRNTEREKKDKSSDKSDRERRDRYEESRSNRDRNSDREKRDGGNDRSDREKRDGGNDRSDREKRDGGNDRSDREKRDGGNDRSDREKRDGGNDRSDREKRDGGNDRSDREKRDGGNDRSDREKRDGGNDRSDREKRDGGNDRSDREKRDGGNDRSDRERDRERRQDREEASVNRNNRNDSDRSRDRNGDGARREKDSEKEKDRNDRVRDVEDSNRKTRDNTKRNEKEAVTERSNNKEKNNKMTSNRDKYSSNNNDSSDKEDSRRREVKNKDKKGGENRKSKDDRKKSKNKSKKDKRKSSEEEDSSTEESDSDTSESSDDSDNENRNGGRYWDSFDIANKETVQKHSKDKGTSKIKRSEKRREW